MTLSAHSPGSLFEIFSHPISPPLVTISLHANHNLSWILAQLPNHPPMIDSIMHVMVSPGIYGIHGNSKSSICILQVMGQAANLIDCGSNVCVTSNLGILLEVIDINPFAILVALDGAPSFSDNCITKHGLLPLTLSNVTTYYQACFYCSNIVETIIFLAMVLAASNIFVGWIRSGTRTPPSQVVSGSPAMMSASQCTSCCTAGMVCTTALVTCTSLTKTLSASLANVLPHHPCLLGCLLIFANHLNFILPASCHKSSPKSGRYALDFPVNTSWMSSPCMCQLLHRSLSTTPSTSLTSVNRPTSANGPPSTHPTAYQHVLLNSSWTSDSCTRPPTSTNAQTSNQLCSYLIQRLQRLSSHH
jgi:hypothetical protein